MNDMMKIAQALKDSNILLKKMLKKLTTKQKNTKNNFQACYQVLKEQVC